MVAGAYLQHLNAPQQWHKMNLREKEGIKQLLYCLFKCLTSEKITN